MNSLAWVFLVSFVVWAYYSIVSIHDMRHATQLEKQQYEETFIYVAAVFAGLLIAEVVAVDIAKEYMNIREEWYMAVLLAANLFIIFLFRNKQRENNKKTYAKQKQNFDLKSKKITRFGNRVKDETKTDLGYYHLTPVFNKTDMTIDSMKLAAHTKTEYNLLKRELKKPFKTHLVYRELIGYYNRKGKDYGLKTVDYEHFLEIYTEKNRGTAEMNITGLYLDLVKKRIPVRISQLLQYASDRKYLKNYIYFLMCIESKKFVPNAVLYAMLHIEHGKRFKNEK